MSDIEVKRGDGPVPLTFHLGTDLTGYETATVLLRRTGAAVVEVPGEIVPGTGGSVTAELTTTHTATVGDYNVEVEMNPGPHTWPSGSYLSLSVRPDLNPS